MSIWLNNLIRRKRTMDREKSAEEVYREMLQKERNGEPRADTMQEEFERLKARSTKDMVIEDMNDRVNHPPHYTWLEELCGIEVIDITRHMDFCLGNCIKYILRAGHKSEEGMSDREKTIEDLKKARFYLDDKIKTLEK